MTDSIADVLEEYAEYLELDGQEGRSHAYEKAARSIRQSRYIAPDPANMDNIGESIRSTIATYQRSGEIAELEALKDEYSWFEQLREVRGIGPNRARQINEKFHVEDLDDLILVGDDLEMLPRVGEKTARKMLDSAHELREQ